jgi:phosphatidylserine/phosphatidylglycerophosphate/cardiolipin synthase-like enzyme
MMRGVLRDREPEYHGTPMAGPPPCKPPQLPVPGPNAAVVDPADPNFQNWFIAPRQSTDCNGKSVANQTVWSGNDVTTFLYAREAWIAMKDEIDKTLDASQFIYVVGLDLGIDTNMTIGLASTTTFGQLLTQADERGVQIRALLQRFSRNMISVPFVNALANGAAIFDNRLPTGGTHHQKILVVSGKDGLVAFCGGMDIAPDRANWHDVHCRIRGPAAQDLHRNFTERWLDHPDVSKLASAKQKVTAPGTVPKGPGDKHVQVVRTFAQLGSPGYCFAQQGEHSIYDAVAKAIGLAQQFIYLEDQYLVEATPMKVGPSISKMLAKKLLESTFKQLVILIARTEGLNAAGEFANPPQGWARRRNFINDLLNADRSKVIVCQYRVLNHTVAIDFNSPTHVHSKTWIFDDKFAIFGSANCDRVGYTHHSEADVCIADQNSNGNRASFAHDLRIRLWLKHLNPLYPASPVFQTKDVVDPFQAAIYFRCPHPASPIEKYNPDGDKYLTSPNLGAKDNPGPNADSDWDRTDFDGS